MPLLFLLMVNVYKVHSLFVLLLIILAVLSNEESSRINSNEPWIIELNAVFLWSWPWTTRCLWCHLGPSTLTICYPSDWFWWGINLMDVRILRIDEWLMFSSPWFHICMWNYIVYLNSSECRMILCHVVHQNRSLAHHGSSKLDFNIDALMWRPTCTSEINGMLCLAVIQILCNLHTCFCMDRIAYW